MSKVKFELQVHLAQDDETGRWYIAESDIPGLELEAENAAALMQKVEAAAPEMIELNLHEIIETHCPDMLTARPEPAPKAAWSYRPVFDSPLGAAFA